MAVLMERVIQQNIDRDLLPWKVEDYIPEVRADYSSQKLKDRS
jgi:hypothetical protein